MRLTVCLEGNTEGRVLASVDMEEIVKMTITDDIEKSNFNPKMLKSATDLAYQCGYQQGRADAIDEFVKKICEKYTEEESKGNYKQYCGEIKQNIADIAEQLKAKEQNK